MSTPWYGQKITSPTTRFIRNTCDPYAFWAAELKAVWPEFDPADANTFWKLLSAIYALTEEEHLKLRATDAYAFTGGSPTTGKRKLHALIDAGLVLAARNPGRRNEKLVSISDEARTAVLRTLDQWASYFEAGAAYRAYRSACDSQPAHH
jgi:hypothetical protein